jgi:nucleoid-associated protein YgaU
MATSTAELRRSASSDTGMAQTKALASLVGVMIVAAVAALILVAFNHSSKSHNAAGTQPAASDVGHQSTTTPSVTTSAAPAPATTSAAPATKTATGSSATPTKSPSSTAAKTPTKGTDATSASRKPITYVVKHGDNLTVIAAWFHQHGYGHLYDLNRAKIGSNPNLIFPGEKITIAHGTMTTS